MSHRCFLNPTWIPRHSRRNSRRMMVRRPATDNHSAGGHRSLERGFLRLRSSTPRRHADLAPVSEAIAPTGGRTNDDAVLALQRESESQHLARFGVAGLL